MLNIYISYSRTDLDTAEYIESNLSTENLDIWIDYREIHAGDSFLEKMNQGLQNASYLLLLWSENLNFLFFLKLRQELGELCLDIRKNTLFSGWFVAVIAFMPFSKVLYFICRFYLLQGSFFRRFSCFFWKNCLQEIISLAIIRKKTSSYCCYLQ